jgi:3-oxoacyl-[acyl-carrier-protein] synthase III
MDETLSAVGAKPDDVDWFVPHQANIRILDGTARKFGIEAGRS